MLLYNENLLQALELLQTGKNDKYSLCNKLDKANYLLHKVHTHNCVMYDYLLRRDLLITKDLLIQEILECIVNFYKEFNEISKGNHKKVDNRIIQINKIGITCTLVIYFLTLDNTPMTYTTNFKETLKKFNKIEGV